MEFPKDKFKIKNDRYAKTRGGNSKFLYIACGNCSQPLMIYQKDGPGKLLRCYVDRIVWSANHIDKQTGSLECLACGKIVANHMIYKPENRPAYRLTPNSTHLARDIS
jgi:ribosomal protein S27E